MIIVLNVLHPCCIMSFRPVEDALPISATPLITMATDMNVLDMPVDPNEPTYCLCHQVSTYLSLARDS